MRLGWIVPAALLGLACSLFSHLGAPTRTPAPAESTADGSTSAPIPGLPPTGNPPDVDFPPTPSADWTDDQGQRSAMLDAFAAEVAGFPGATRYWIEASVELDLPVNRAVIHGLERLRFTNPLARPLDDLVLMTWPNDEQYAGEMTAGPAMIDGDLVAGTSEADGLGLRFALPRPLPPGGSLDLALPFRLEIDGAILPNAPRRLGIAAGVLLAPTFYPLVPRLSAEGVWETELAPPGGDTTNSDIALYDVVLNLPGGVELAATGSEIERTELPDGRQRVRLASGPVRDFALALGPFTTAEARAGDILVRASVLEPHAQAAQATARLAARAVEVFEALLGPYPYDELDVVDAPGAFGGIEYPGLVYIGVIGEPGDDLVIVHEVAHQWFYALIGNDQLDEPWLDEASATYAEVLYLEAIGEPQAALGLLDQFRSILRSAGDSDPPVGRPIDGYADESQYGVIVYLKGALFLDALRSRLGESTFQAFLRAYFERHRYGFATSASFQETAEAACACDLDDLFDLWVYSGGALRFP